MRQERKAAFASTQSVEMAKSKIPQQTLVCTPVTRQLNLEKAVVFCQGEDDGFVVNALACKKPLKRLLQTRQSNVDGSV